MAGTLFVAYLHTMPHYALILCHPIQTYNSEVDSAKPMPLPYLYLISDNVTEELRKSKYGEKRTS